MAIPVNTIGAFSFIALEGNPEKLKRQVAMFSRAGVDGVTLARLGTRGVRFTLRSKVDFDNITAARQGYVGYCGLIGADPVELRWRRLDLLSEQYKVAVLEVREIECRPMLISSGGLSAEGLGFLVCDWDLVAIKY